MNLKELKTQRDQILSLAEKHGAKNLRVFGSVVHGDAGPGSDIDFLIEAGPKRTPFFPGGLVKDLEALLHHKVDIVTEKSLHWYIRDKVLNEAVPL